jgi:hypothetical protein
MISKFKAVKDLGFRTYTSLFENCVAPILDYCSGVWGHKVYKKADSVQNRAIRFYLGVHCYAPISAINGEIGWDICQTRWKGNMFRLWNRLIEMDNNRLTKKIFNWDYILNCNNWSANMQMLFMTLNRNDIYQTQMPCNVQLMLEYVRQLAISKWKEEILAKPKLRTYTNFKSEYTTEPYLEMNINRAHRSYLAQFRCGILPIRIEVGRFKGEDVSERICEFCDLGKIEDEYHFLIECCKYNDARDALFGFISEREFSFTSKLSSEKFVHIIKEYPR